MYSEYVNIDLFISMHTHCKGGNAIFKKIEGTQNKYGRSVLDEDISLARDDWEEVQNYIAAE
jgi:hypothetical protein